jgi:hypothetical protein
MLFTSKHIKSYVYLILLCCSVYIAKAMEQPTPEMEKIAEEETALIPFGILPEEIKVDICKYVTTSANVQQAADTITTIAMVNKEFNRLINSADVTRYSLRQLSDISKIDPIGVAAFLRTSGAKDWLIKEVKKQCLVREMISFISAIRQQMSNLVEENPTIAKANWTTEGDWISARAVSPYEKNPRLSEEAYIKGKKLEYAKAFKRLKILIESVFASLNKDDYNAFIDGGISDLEASAKFMDTDTKEPGLSDRLGFKDSIDMLKACVEKNK